MYRYFSIIILLSACSTSSKECVEQLNKELGNEYAAPLAELTGDFERMVMNTDGSGFADKCRNFLKPLASGNDKEFYSKIAKSEELVNAVVGLDTMIFKYEYYQSDSRLTRKYISTYWNSRYIQALSTLKECDDLITKYVTTIEETGGIGPVLVAEGAIFNYSDEDFNNPIVKRILAVEILLPYLNHTSE
jgi:hypothetical protein